MSNDILDNLRIDEEDVEEDGDDQGAVQCCYPTCVFANMPTSPPLDECQGTCDGKHRFQHACNVNWLESNEIDAELSILCFDCVCSKYAHST